jgi:hypothetical protein
MYVLPEANVMIGRKGGGGLPEANVMIGTEGGGGTRQEMDGDREILVALAARLTW